MKTTIYIIRHGETTGNKARIFQGQIDTPLNDIGKLQILEACKDMVRLGITYNYIYCSPLSRAKESAEIIQSYFPSNKVLQIEPLAIERAFGEAEGKAINPSNYNKIMKNEFRDAETEDDVILRAQTLIKRLLAEHPGKNILIVSHSHFIKACFKPYLPNLRFDDKTINGGISRLVFNEFNHCVKADLLINPKDH